MSFETFESLPVWVICIAIALMILLSCEVGFRLGLRMDRSRLDKDAPTSVGPMVGGLLGMLGFVLAITFSMASGQYDLRKQNVLNEANAIGTAYLRTDLLPEPHASAFKDMLRKYVDIRVAATAAGASGKLNEAIAESVELQGEMWTLVSAAASAQPTTNTALLVQATNDVIDMHEKRITGALHNRIPLSVWLALLSITSLTMITMGLQVGLTGKRRLAAVLPLALAFSVLVTLVADLNRPQSGLIIVGQSAMIDLQQGMATAPK